MVSAEKFWDRQAVGYAKKPIKNMQAYNETMARTRSYLSKGDNVLEIGCGSGSTALLLADNVKHITASDISSKMIEIGTNKAREQQIENATFIRGEVFDDAFAKGSFDVVLAYNLLHLMENRPAVIRRIHELLRPEGLFISKTLCFKGHMSIWRVLIPIFRLIGYAPYVGVFTIPEFEGLITDANFQIIETGLYPPSPPARFIVARKRPATA